MKKNILMIIAAWIVVSALFYFFLRRDYDTRTPPFVLSKLQDLKLNKLLMDSIGSYHNWQFTFNELDYELRDTVRYTIRIEGGKRTLVHDGTQVKRGEQCELFTEDLRFEESPRNK